MNNPKTPDEKFLEAQIAVLIEASPEELDEHLMATGLGPQDVENRGMNAVKGALTNLQVAKRAAALMKTPINHRTLWLILTFFILFWGASSVFAKGSSHSKASDGGGSVMSFDAAPRTLHFWETRNAVSKEGYILVCSEEFKADYNGNCTHKKSGENMWQLLEQVVPQGFKIVGYEYRFVGSSGSRILVVYLGQPKPEPVPLQKAEAMIVQPTFTGPITIMADKVVVRRKRAVIPKLAQPASTPK